MIYCNVCIAERIHKKMHDEVRTLAKLLLDCKYLTSLSEYIIPLLIMIGAQHIGIRNTFPQG